MSDVTQARKGFLRASRSRDTGDVNKPQRTVEVVHSDVNDVVADVVALPIGCALSPVRRVARAAFERSPSAAAHLARLASTQPEGVLPTSVVIFPKGTHARGGRIAIAAVHDDRPHSDVDAIEPDATRIRVSALRIFDACEQARETSLAMAPLGGIDMEAHEAVAIAADALVEYWRTHPTSAIARVVFFERTPERTLELVDVVRARFPDATVRRDHDATTVITPVGQASVPASVPTSVGQASVPASVSSGRAPPLVPPPTPPPAIVAPFGLPTTTKHTSRLLFESWQGACGGSPIPAGCTGVAFRFASPPSSVSVTLRVHATALKNAWLDGQPLADGRASLSVGEHVLAVECGAGAFAVLVDGMVGRNTPLAKVRAVADGAVSCAPSIGAKDWIALVGMSGAAFTPVTTSSTAPLPDWTAQQGVLLPPGTRYVRFVFPIVFGASP